MKCAEHSLFDTPRKWGIVTAGFDVAHVFLPLTGFTFTPGRDKQGIEGFKLTYSCQKPQPDCFEGTFFVKMGCSTPTFQEAVKDLDIFNGVAEPSLPKYDDSPATVDRYEAVSEALRTHLMKDRDVQRLEGIIRVPCHPHGAPIEADYVQGHSPLWIKTIVQVFQFPDAVEREKPLLVIRTPLSPTCPMNSDGTAIGLSR